MNELKKATDVWFCAFVINKGHSIKKYDVLSRGKVCCYFEITEDEWKSLKLEFNNSELINFKGIINNIKDLAF